MSAPGIEVTISLIQFFFPGHGVTGIGPPSLKEEKLQKFPKKTASGMVRFECLRRPNSSRSLPSPHRISFGRHNAYNISKFISLRVVKYDNRPRHNKSFNMLTKLFDRLMRASHRGICATKLNMILSFSSAIAPGHQNSSVQSNS